MLNLTEAVKAITIDEAIKIALNAKEEYKVDPQKVVVALLKLQSLESLIGDALKNVTDELMKTLKKKNEVLEASTDVKIKNPDGSVTNKVLTVNIKSFDNSTTKIEFDVFKEDSGFVVENDPNDPCVKHIRVLDPQVFSVLNAPTMAGNPTAFEAAIVANPALGKYKTTKTTSKYVVAIDLADSVNN